MANETLTVNGVLLSTPAFWIENLGPLLADADVRGADLVLAGAIGARGRRRRRTATVYTFKLWVIGDVDHAGTPYADARMGLVSNFEYLKANLGEASSAIADGTVTATWTRNDGSTKAAQVHVIGPHNVNRRSLTLAVADLQLSAPAGVFA